MFPFTLKCAEICSTVSYSEIPCINEIQYLERHLTLRSMDDDFTEKIFFFFFGCVESGERVLLLSPDTKGSAPA